MEKLDEFYVVQVKTDKIKNHIVPLEEWEKIFAWYTDPSRKPHDVINIRNWATKFMSIMNVFKSYDHSKWATPTNK